MLGLQDLDMNLFGASFDDHHVLMGYGSNSYSLTHPDYPDIQGIAAPRSNPRTISKDITKVTTTFTFVFIVTAYQAVYFCRVSKWFWHQAVYTTTN